MKSLFKKIIISILWGQVVRLNKKNNFKIIAVVGSIGKTSTKIAIAKALSSSFRVRFQEGNYNDIISIPLVFFGKKMPNLLNIFEWISIIIKNELQIINKFEYDFVVLEIGTDAPGQIDIFRKYLNVDVAVVTAITEEHMEFFEDLNDVALEEWSISYFSKIIYANKDLCKIIPPNIDRKKIIYYGKDYGSEYKIQNIFRNGVIFDFEINHNGKIIANLKHEALSEVELYSITLAYIISKKFNISDDLIKKTFSKLKAFKGRMQKLHGIKDSIIIDDSYNSSPDSTRIALDALYAFPQKQKIAVLGMMNELGNKSNKYHEDIGSYCKPGLLDMVITIGEDANKYLAPSAKSKGCRVYEAKNSHDAGLYLKDIIKEDCAVLVKGSQNGVFAEEAIKPILKNKLDVDKLVRQEEAWIIKKQKYLES
jgi:UDP-N-acetylmuramoyl-tripeptide--D-alanyl-D-alanine ligase